MSEVQQKRCVNNCLLNDEDIWKSQLRYFHNEISGKFSWSDAVIPKPGIKFSFTVQESENWQKCRHFSEIFLQKHPLINVLKSTAISIIKSASVSENVLWIRLSRMRHILEEKVSNKIDWKLNFLQKWIKISEWIFDVFWDASNIGESKHFGMECRGFVLKIQTYLCTAGKRDRALDHIVM